jgi:hypothetical protein
MARCRLRRRRDPGAGKLAEGQLSTPKSGKVRSVPMAPDVATALAGPTQRGRWTDDDDLVFVGPHGSFLDGRALRRRYPTAIGRATCAPPLPRPAPHVRHANDRQGRHRPCAGVDGTRRCPDDHEVPPLRATRRRRGTGRGGVCGSAGRWTGSHRKMRVSGRLSGRSAVCRDHNVLLGAGSRPLDRRLEVVHRAPAVYPPPPAHRSQPDFATLPATSRIWSCTVRSPAASARRLRLKPATQTLEAPRLVAE